MPLLFFSAKKNAKNNQSNIIFKSHQDCLQAAVTRPKLCEDYFQKELESGNFHNGYHAIIGDINTFIKDIQSLWDVKDLGANRVIKFIENNICNSAIEPQ